MSVGERIRERRIKLGLSQAQLAFKVDTESNAVSRWERDVIHVGQKYILKLAQVLETSTGYLLGETDDPTPPDPSVVVSPPVEPKEPPGYSGRLIIRQGDLYINLPETPEGYEALRTFLATRGINNSGPTSQVQ